MLNVSGQVARDTVNDRRRDVEQRTVVLVDEFLDARGEIVENFGGGSGFNPDTEGFYGLGIDFVSLPSSTSSFPHRISNFTLTTTKRW
jgi:hypothetical protein